MGDYNLSLEIKTVGANTALAALDDLDRKGRAIVEDVAGATGRAMGDVAAAYVNGSKRVQMALEDIALAHRENIAELEAQGTAAERLSSRYGTAGVSAARALEVIGRTGKETGRSLDTLIAQASQVAFSFGSAGPIVGAIGIATAAVVEMMLRASKQSKQLVDDIAKDFERIARMDVKGQGEATQLLYNGDPNATFDKDGNVNVARFGLKELQRQQADFLRRQTAGTFSDPESGVSMTADANEAADALKRVNAELQRRNDLLKSVMGPGGSFGRAAAEGVASDQPGFITDQLKAQEDAAKAAARQWDKAVKAFSDDVEQRKKDFDELVRTTVGKLTNSDDPNLSGAERVNRFDARSFGEAGGPLGTILDGIIPDSAVLAKQLHESVRLAVESLKDNPAIEWVAESKKLGDNIGKQLGQGLGTGLTAGFEAAFSGKGVIGFIEGFGQSMLGALGRIFIQQGEALISFSAIMKGLGFALANPITAPWAAAAEGAALIALGAALSAAAHGGGGSSGGSGSSYSSPALPPDFLSFGVQTPTAPTTGLPAPSAQRPISFTIIGPDDPKAQRAIGDIVKRANSRGLT